METRYRLLAIGERRQGGDETFDPFTEGWCMMQDIGIGMRVAEGDKPVRRALRPWEPARRFTTRVIAYHASGSFLCPVIETKGSN